MPPTSALTIGIIIGLLSGGTIGILLLLWVQAATYADKHSPRPPKRER